MPKGQCKHYTKEFKLSAVYLMLGKTMRPKEIFAMLNVDRQTVYRWVQEFKANGEKAFEEKGVTRGDEIKRLQKDLADLKMENEILKKSNGILCKSQSERVEFAIKNLKQYSTSKVCRLLKIARSSYYYRTLHPQHPRYTQEECDTVYQIFLLHNGSFGRRVIKRELEKVDVHYSERKISGILKQMNLRSKYGRKKCKNVYTSKNTEKYIHENLYMQLCEKARAYYEIWSMDFTEVKIGNKKVCICGIISATSKIFVGLARGKSCTAALAIEALQNALSVHDKPYMIMTDRGGAFTSKAFYDMLQEKKILHSMSRPYTPVDNRFIETFWKTMKIEIGKTNHLDENTYAMVLDYFIYYYNNLRPHSSLDYETPIQHQLKKMSFAL